MRVLLQDLGYAFRQLRKTPGFTVTVLLTLALGIGANSAIFTLVNAILLHNLPVTDPKTLIRIGDQDDCCVNSGWDDKGDYSLFATDTYYMFKKSLPEFEELAAMESGYAWRPITVRRAGPQTVAKSVMGTFVSGNYFRVFGLSPAAGRLFMDADDQKGAPITAVMSYDAWQQDYAGDPSVVGSAFYINTKPATIIGVAPKGFYGDRIDTNPPKYFLPMNSMDGVIGAPYFTDPDTQWAYIIGRVKPGTSLPALQAKASALLKQQFAPLKTFTDQRAQKVLPLTHVVLTPGGGGIQNMQDGYKDHLKLLQWIAALVLLVACANIANLLLVRGMSRRAELSIRSALGAQRSRIVRQLLTESVLLSGMGGLLGLAVSYLGAHALLALAFPDQHNMPVTASPSPLVIGFAFALSLVTGILFGLAPALMAARTQPAEALRSNARTTAHGASFLQRALVVLQAALSLVLLVAAGLFAQSLNKAENVDMKLDATNRYIAHINPQAAGYKNTEVEPLYQTIVDRFHAIPGVLKVGLCHLHADGGEQLGIWRKGSGRAGPEQRRILGEGHPGVLRLRRHPRRHGPRLHVAGHAECAAGRRRQPGIRQAVLRQPQSHRPSLWFFRPDEGRLRMERMRSSAWWKTPPTPASTGRTTPCTFCRSRSAAGNGNDPDIPSRQRSIHVRRSTGDPDQPPHSRL